MKVLLPIVYAGNVSYYKALKAAQHVCLETQEHYIKQTYRNRCTIFGANGPLDLIIPVTKSKAGHQPLGEVKINYNQNWQRLHWKSLESAYRSSPYFDHYQYEFEQFYQTPYDLLIDFNLALQKTILQVLEWDIPVEFTTSWEAKPENTIDQRSLAEPWTPNTELKPYTQVFDVRHGFMPNLSVFDLLFNCGPQSADYL